MQKLTPARPPKPLVKLSYWAQKTPGPLSFPAPPVPPAPTTSPPYVVLPATATPPSPPPKEFINQYFDVISASPFGAKEPLPSSCFISRAELLCAAISSGYSKNLMIGGQNLAKTSPDLKELRIYLTKRLETLLSCLDHSKGDIRPKRFYELVESSEKVGLSFIVGSLGTYVGARRWISATGHRITCYLHAGIYSRATSVTPSALVTLTKAIPNGKVPDFLVKDDANNWHVFESKGGATSSRWPQVIAGLKQLENVRTVSQGISIGQPPLTKACVHTVFDSGRPIAISLIDPPGNEVPDGSFASPKNLDINLVPGVAQCLSYLEAIDWFFALTQINENPQQSNDPSGWVLFDAPAFPNIRVGIHRAILEQENHIRGVIRKYLALQEVLEEIGGQELDGVMLPAGLTLPPKPLFLKSASRLKDALGDPEQVHTAILAKLKTNQSKVLVGALQAWGEHLEIQLIAEKLDQTVTPSSEEVTLLKLRNSGHISITPSKLLVQENNSMDEGSSSTDPN